jgi:hypothetical protein
MSIKTLSCLNFAALGLKKKKKSHVHHHCCLVSGVRTEMNAGYCIPSILLFDTTKATLLEHGHIASIFMRFMYDAMLAKLLKANLFNLSMFFHDPGKYAAVEPVVPSDKHVIRVHATQHNEIPHLPSTPAQLEKNIK